MWVRTFKYPEISISLLAATIGVAFFVFSSSAQAFTGSGAGTEGDPYQITSCVQLQEMQDSLDAHYVLTDNIDCSDTINWNSGAGFIPVGTLADEFTGVLDGDGYVVSDLFIDKTGGFVGLFGNFQRATATDIGVVSASITGTVDSVGGLIGYAFNSYISGAFFSGTVESVGQSVGGLVGWHEDWGGGIISESYSEGSVTGGQGYVGGLVGRKDDGILRNSYSTADVVCTCTAPFNSTGGLVGYGYGSITDSYSTGDVEGRADVGGFIGLDDGGTTVDSYTVSTATGTATTTVNGLIGRRFGTITNSSWLEHAGGPANCYHSGGNTGCTKVTTGESTFFDYSVSPISGWDFDTVWSTFFEDTGHPVLQMSIHTLTYTAGAGGSIVGDTGQEVFSGTSGAQVTATPDAGYSFTEWSDGVLTAARTDTSVYRSTSVSATFSEISEGSSSGAGRHTPLPHENDEEEEPETDDDDQDTATTTDNIAEQLEEIRLKLIKIILQALIILHQMVMALRV